MVFVWVTGVGEINAVAIGNYLQMHWLCHLDEQTNMDVLAKLVDALILTKVRSIESMDLWIEDRNHNLGI